MNGFQFSRLNLAGSAVWFCIFVPVIPIYLIKFGRIDMYDRPWIYVVSEDGTMKRYREKNSSGITWKSVLRLLFVPPACFAVWFGVACFCTMCYLTAFGFG